MEDKKRALYLFFAVTASFIFLISSISFALSDLGGVCTSTGDCRIGYCKNSTCRLPTVLEKFSVTANCSYTAECMEGFCKDGECILPIREEYDILSFGAKSGCAGVIENCTGIFCVFCDISWGLLVIGSTVAAFLGRRRGGLVPFVLFFLPVLIGFIIFPIFGFFLALVEIVIITVTRKTATIKFK